MEKKNKPKLLVLAKTVPLFDRASGDFRLWQILQILSQYFSIDYLSTARPAIHKNSGQLGYPIKGSILHPDAYEYIDSSYIESLKQIGVNYIATKEELPIRSQKIYDIKPYIKKTKYDAVWVEFYYTARDYFSDLRKFQSQAKIIVDSVDLHYRRENLEYEHLSKAEYELDNQGRRQNLSAEWHKQMSKLAEKAQLTKMEELNIYRLVDLVVTVSKNDAADLAKAGVRTPQVFIPNLYPPISHTKPGFEEREGIVFVGNFDHSPNISSAVSIQQDLAPLLRKRMGKIPIYIVGSNPPARVKAMSENGPCADQIKVTGYVPEISSYLDKARVSIAPINYGAGMNGKIAEAMLHGLPVVTSQLGAAGMELQTEEHCLVAKNPAEFVDAIARIYENKKVWEFYQQEGRKFVENILGIENARKTIVKELLPFVREKKNHKTNKWTVVLITYNQWRFTKLCLQSLEKAWKACPKSIRPKILVIDNNSTDETVRELKKVRWLKVVANKTNIGFAKACNQAIKLSPEQDVLFLNNDTLVPPNFLVDFHSANIVTQGKALLTSYCHTEPAQEVNYANYRNPEEYYAEAKALSVFRKNHLKPIHRASGTVLFIPDLILKTVGEFDEGYGIGYFEDDDYCLRSIQAGFSIQLIESILVHHFGSISFSATPGSKLVAFQNAYEYFFMKWGSKADELMRLSDR